MVYAPHTLFSHQVTPHTYHNHQYSYIPLTNSWIPKLPKGDYRSQRVIKSKAMCIWEMRFHSHTYMHLKPFNFKRPLALIGIQGNENHKHRIQFSKIHNTRWRHEKEGREPDGGLSRGSCTLADPRGGLSLCEINWKGGTTLFYGYKEALSCTLETHSQGRNPHTLVTTA